jgi:hypothetical protein
MSERLTPPREKLCVGPGKDEEVQAPSPSPEAQSSIVAEGYNATHKHSVAMMPRMEAHCDQPFFNSPGGLDV